MRKNTKIFIGLLLIIVIVVGIFVFKKIKQNVKQNDRSFIEFINVIMVEPYAVHYINSYSSSGGGGETEGVRTISTQELGETVAEIKNIVIENSFLSKNKIFKNNKKCFYTLSDNSSPWYLVCFLGNKIVNYIKINGPDRISWYVVGNENNKRSSIINSISDLQTCNIDSDCTLESLGVCIPQNNNQFHCLSNSINCDSGYRLAINNKYSFVWSGLDYNEDQCIDNRIWGDYEKHEYYKAVCESNKCKTLVVRDEVSPVSLTIPTPSPIVDNIKMINARGEVVDKFVKGTFKIIGTNETFEYIERYNSNQGDGTTYNSNAVNDCIKLGCKVIYFKSDDFYEQGRIALFNDKDGINSKEKLIEAELKSYQYFMSPDTGEVFPVIKK